MEHRYTRALAFLIAVFPAAAEYQALRAEIVEKVATREGWSLLLRDRNYRLFRCLLPPEKDVKPALLPGDVVEWSQRLEPGECWVADLKFLGRPSDPSMGLRGSRLRLDLNPLNSFMRRGNLNYGGTVTDVQDGRIELRTRQGERLPVLIRDDTHFFRNGLPSSSAYLVRNMVISVRAGRNYRGDVEAFYIMWGAIVQPR